MTRNDFHCVFDPGHGGVEPAGKSSPFGTAGPGGLHEKDITLRLASRAAQQLSREAKVALTRTGDYNVSLAERAAMGRRVAADAFVSIHAGPGGDQVFVHPSAPSRAWQLARAVAQELSRFGGRTPPRVVAAPIGVLDPRHVGPKTAACSIEVGYGGTRYGDASWRDESRLNAISASIAQALRSFHKERELAVNPNWGIDTDSTITSFVPSLAATPLPGSVAPSGATVGFVCRYLRSLSAAEVTALHNAGLTIVSVFERGNSANYFTRAQGSADGAEAIRQASALGQPTEAPIYFAVDYDDANFYKGNFANVDQYFQGVADAMAADPDHAYPVGVYGSVCVMSHLQTTGAASWFWQSLSTGWCGNAKPWPDANIRQLTPPNATFPGTTLRVDYDCSDQANEGSW